MSLKQITMRLRAVLRPRAVERELDEEIRFHIEQEIATNVQAGMKPDEARRRALLAFGGVERTKEEYRDGRGDRWFAEFVSDARYALRTLRRNPAVTIAVAVTLALGIGANVAIFSAVNAVILRPLPFPASDRLAMVWEDNPDKGWIKAQVAPANMLDWREQVGAFEDVAAYGDFDDAATLTGFGEPQVLRKVSVTGNFFSVLGVRAAMGRALEDRETWASGTRVAVISHRAWRERLGGDAAIVGRTIELDGHRVQVVGIMPERFSFPTSTVDVWLPVAWGRDVRAEAWFRRAHWMRAIARVRPGVSLEQGAVQLREVATRLQQQYPQTNAHMSAGMGSLHEFLVGDTRTPLLVLLGASGVLLLIACANVGNLLLVRAAAREREVVLRRALGAHPFRIARQALTESLVLSAIGGIGGFALGWAGTRALVALQPAGLLPVGDVQPDAGVYLFVLAISTLSGLLFGLAPAIWSGRRAPSDVLKEGARIGSDSRRVRSWGNALVVGEVALALVLTLGAGLLGRSLWRLAHVEPGFEPRGVLAVSLSLPRGRYDSDEKVAAFYAELTRRVATIPGAEGAAVVSRLPLVSSGWTSDFAVSGRAPSDFGREVMHREISPDYFKVMRVPLVAGRPFAESDGRDTERVIIVNQALVDRYFRGQNPLGQRVTFDRVPDSTSVWRTIVGVVGNEHQETLALDPRIEIFAPQTQDQVSSMTLVIRTRGEPATLARPVRSSIATIDPALAVLSTKTMDEVIGASLIRERFLAMLLLGFAAVGVVLAIVGVYGVMAQLAMRRTREMGIRIALGAPSSAVRWLIVRHGILLMAAGLAVGTGTALLATSAIEKLLFQVAPLDVPTFVAMPLLLSLSGLLAAWIPATRATRADPVNALREA
jgi:predicted permease